MTIVGVWQYKSLADEYFVEEQPLLHVAEVTGEVYSIWLEPPWHCLLLVMGRWFWRSFISVLWYAKNNIPRSVTLFIGFSNNREVSVVNICAS